MGSEIKSSHSGFIRRSGIFISLIFLSNIFELGFNAISARLPEGGYSAFATLFNIFSIVIAPLVSIQLIVSKEVSKYNSLGESGKAREFIERSFRYIVVISLIIMTLGIISSYYISGFLRIESILPVILLMVIIGLYSPFPVLYGTIQGLKKFTALGLVAFSWCFFRFLFAFISVIVFSSGLKALMFGVIVAVIVCTILAWIPVRSLFKEKRTTIGKNEIREAYSLVFPIIVTLFSIAVLKNIDIVFAKRFFSPLSADAYTCAARVGSGFFVLTGISMVMFPHVSEEKTHSRNPIAFLIKSFVVTIILSLAGIVVSWFAPGMVMRIITLGVTIPGAEALIRIIGIAVLPLSLVHIMSNYLLAKHNYGFLPILIAGMVLQIFLITFMHNTPFTLLIMIGTANTAVFTLMLFYIIREHGRYMNISLNNEKQITR